MLAGCGKMNESDGSGAWETQFEGLGAVLHRFNLGVA